LQYPLLLSFRHPTAALLDMKGIVALLVPAVLLASGRATELTAENWDANVGGKTVFIKFLAPW